MRKTRLLSVMLGGVVLGICTAGVASENDGYAILTTSAIVAQSTQLTSFVAAKSARGFDVQVVVNTAGGWGVGVGTNAAMRMRDWLKANYVREDEQVINYVLLIGDPNPTNGAVPMMSCHPFVNTNGVIQSQSSNMVPTDFFYADLTGDWDKNGNGVYGDYYDYLSNGVSRAYQVAVGRIPFYGNIAELDGILSKIQRYENAAVTNRAWRRKAVVAFPDMDGFLSSTPGRESAQPFVDDLLRPSGFRVEALYPDSLPWCSVSNTVEVLNREHPGVVAWFTHGLPKEASDVMTSARVGLLNDAYPAFVAQGSCLNGKPEVAGNLGYALLSTGAVATVSASRESWFFPLVNFIFRTPKATWFGHGTAPRILYDYLENLVGQEMPAGDAFYAFKAKYAPIRSNMASADASALWANYLMFNLYGDPSVGLSEPYGGMMCGF